MKNIKFKVTASKKLKCDYCKKKVAGKEGYIAIKPPKSHYYGYITYGYITPTICWKCFIEFLKEMKEGRENREELFQKSVKRCILKKL